MINRNDHIQQIGQSFGRLKRAMHAYAGTAFQDLGLSFTQLGLLRTISHMQPVSHKDLAAYMQLTPGAVSQYIDALDQAGCIVRMTNDSDRRSSYLSVSRDGKVLLSRYDKLWQQMLTSALADVADHEVESYLAVQQSISEWLETKAIKK